MKNIEWAKEWISQQEFVEAKSYSMTFPHFYTTRNRCNEKEFEMFLDLIRYYGKLKSFFTKQYLYLEINGFEYWEMGRPIKAVQVLNKAKIDDTQSYRKTPIGINDELTLKNKLAEREVYLDFLLSKNEKELNKTDLKSINFLMDTKRRIHGGGKNIIDHSSLKIKYHE